jgi:hypothetical protein
MERWWRQLTFRGKSTYRKGNNPIVTLPTTDLAWTALIFNPWLRGERLAALLNHI